MNNFHIEMLILNQEMLIKLKQINSNNLGTQFKI